MAKATKSYTVHIYNKDDSWEDCIEDWSTLDAATKEANIKVPVDGYCLIEENKNTPLLKVSSQNKITVTKL